MKARAGITLIETLVAIFIMAIGLLALLTLFPLGALSMANAIKDQRVAEAGQQAIALGNARGVRTDANVTPVFAKGVFGTLPATWDGPSYPVYADPWGRVVGGVNFSTVGGVMQRTVLAGAGSRANAMRWCALQDELTFNPDGTPDLSGGGLQREPRTTWAYWLKRPNLSVPNVVEMSIVVYSGRDLALASKETAAANVGYTAADPTAVVLDNSASKPDIRKGMWIVDLTTHDPNSQTDPAERLNARKYGPVHGYWYRVVDVTETTNAGNDALQLELQPKPVVPMKTILIMDGVAEVFPNGTGWK